MIIHNKLVRDKIPQIIENNGKSAVCKTLSESEFPKELDRKLTEEVNEYFESGCIEEIADIIEVLYAICENKGYAIEDLEAIRKKKVEERGAFQKRIFLEFVEEK